MVNERFFKSKLLKKLHSKFPESIITNLNPNDVQGIPDVLILFKNMWATLETKKTEDSDKQLNQSYWVNKMNEMSFSRFISPINEREVLIDLEDFFLKNGRYSR